ncbi:VOC family protein [Metabacillus niabensis]|uniref:VOC family protein n=1 Tax=Metabacillus TaxID=2675233 RepID=UPI0011A19F9B
MSNGNIQGIAYNVIPVQDIMKSANWFKEHFHFNIRHQTENSVSLFKENRPILHLLHSSDESRAFFTIDNKKKWVITFFTDDIKKLHEKLSSKNVQVSKISYEGENGNFFTFEDIDGNIFDVWEHHNCELIF